MKTLVMAFFVWFSYEVCVEKLLMMRMRQSSMSAKPILLSFFFYAPAAFRYLSAA